MIIQALKRRNRFAEWWSSQGAILGIELQQCIILEFPGTWSWSMVPAVDIYEFNMVFLEKKNSQELHCGNVINMSFWLVKFLLKLMLLTTCIHA